ncbi:EscJ/YscJ/HrcJ family type III secretion inner membrane ring protein [Citrobacter amalonaticus]|uniref:Lipoprotein n=1 Tax=Citrobacter amalonaticus TaxID=35703 RepID=A0A2S4S2L1_CITAM|nr:type III secretion inner membrane ring lipoprotein SctJ [Citrobacter amalonaticus]POT59516.1 EscJ/YscJ/HrcJ family type III secretion inner membrane ring protein [Citrobacter amalonaticus]POT77646.1 EscJ/YscJ/HrcJ family type III secretion inner membrane ring protein [Citrobacter amalonaticus]POU68098.1 EscJ/YscJ/HrcJ family type III secretion inner membrane ring protein [Citrobacter amalonaticus]POV07702.1 EscJ/YscJ/HrcJ family type III secretion inner membrane ring protein [Citrobacter ama
MIRKLYPRVFLILCLFILSGCDSELVSNISERQANEIIALLEQNNIDAQKIKGDKGVFSVRVDKGYMSDSIELLNTYNLPSADHVEIAGQFPSDSMVSTPLGEKVRLISAIEQRLGQTIQELDNITTSRVHLSYPLKGDSDESLIPPSASVLLIYKNAINEAEYIDKIKRLIKNSLSTIQYEDISVVIFKKGDAIRPSKAAQSTPEWVFAVAGLLAVSVCVFFALFLFRQRKTIAHAKDSDGKPA